MIYYSVKVKGLPTMFVAASSEAQVMAKLRQMLKRPTEDIESVERVTAADVRGHFRDLVAAGPKVEEKYNPQKHEWGTDAAAEYARSITPGQKKKEDKKVSEGKSFFKLREVVKTADKKPQNYRDSEGRVRTRMVPVDKEVVKEEMSSPVTEALTTLLSDVYLMYFMAHSFHWNVKGEDFHQYHTFLGSLYEDVYGSADDIAERIRIKGAFAPYSLAQLIARSAVEEEDEVVEESNEMMECLLESNQVVLNSLNKCFGMADAEGDQGLMDFLAGRIDAHEKHGWMLRSSYEEEDCECDMEEAVKQPTGKLKGACWKGYTAVGTKKKNGKTVPNCVPKESVDLEEQQKVTHSDAKGPGKGRPMKDLSKMDHVDARDYHQMANMRAKSKKEQDYHYRMSKVHHVNATGGSSMMHKEESEQFDEGMYDLSKNNTRKLQRAYEKMKSSSSLTPKDKEVMAAMRKELLIRKALKEEVGQKVTLESLRSQIAKNSGRFPEGSTVTRKKDGKKGKVMTVGKDFVKVAYGNRMVDHKPHEVE